MNYKITRSESYQASIKPSSEDIKHYKYIKREKGKNGKWRYYYEETENDAKKSDHDPAVKEAFETSWNNSTDPIDYAYKLDEEFGRMKALAEDEGTEEDIKRLKKMFDYYGFNYNDVKARRDRTPKVDPDSKQKARAHTNMTMNRPSVKNNPDTKQGIADANRLLKRLYPNRTMPSKLYK